MCWHKRVIQTGILLLLGLVIVTGGTEASTVVQPGRFIFDLAAGDVTTGAVEVTNRGDETIEVRAVLYDWTLDDGDQLVIQPETSRKDTLSGLIKFNPRQFRLGPNETQLVRFSIKAPATDFDGERKGIVFFEQESALNAEGIGAKVITQVGTTIYLVPRHAQMVFRLAKATVYFPETGEPLGLVLVGNEGKAHVRYRVHYAIIDALGRVVGEGTGSEQILLPDFHRVVSFPLATPFAKGEYNLMIEIQFQATDQKLVHTVPFNVAD